MKTILFALAAFGAVAVAGYATYTYSTLKAQELRVQAVDGCYQSSLYRNTSTTDQGSVTTEEAIEPSLKKCLEYKGVALK